MDNFLIRPILSSDNKALAAIVRNSLSEFGAARPGTVYFDPTTDHLYELFQAQGSRYYTAVAGDQVAKDQATGEQVRGEQVAGEQVAGGAGIFPSPGLPSNTCELVKMYLRPELRGKGLGRLLIEKCLVFAKEAGYAHIYIETLPELRKAMSVYEKFAFRYLDGPMGNTGHFGCDIWMLKDLE